MLRETGSTSRRDGGDHEITLTGTADEIAAIRRMLTGVDWLTVAEGSVRRCGRFEALPPPERDPLVPVAFPIPKAPPLGLCTKEDLETIQAAINARPKFNVHLGPDFEEEGWRSPSFYLSHLAAGTQLAGAYERNARTLAATGWECMRSRRGFDGKVWERWMLPGAYAAQGTLAAALKAHEKEADFGRTWKLNWNTVVEWAIKNVNFGSLDCTVQRACLTYD